MSSETESKCFIQGFSGTGAQATDMVQTAGSLMLMTRFKKKIERLFP